MTPMIDMTFQLIAFFMVLINFSDVEQDQRVNLPASELAKPPDTAYDEPITMQMTADETSPLQRTGLMTIDALCAAIRTGKRPSSSEYSSDDGENKLSRRDRRHPRRPGEPHRPRAGDHQGVPRRRIREVCPAKGKTQRLTRRR